MSVVEFDVSERERPQERARNASRGLKPAARRASKREPVASDDDDSPFDNIVLLRGLRWDDYERLLEVRGEKAVPRFAYLDGELEIMTPSQPHESLKSRIGCLVEVWCQEKGIEFSPYGSWTLKQQRRKAGVETDECYIFGEPRRKKARPDLAIEVVWTSGNLNKLDIYLRLGVAEVWFWRHGVITVHVRRGTRYVEVPRSKVLPGIDLAELVTFTDRASASRGMREYRAVLNAGKR